MSGSEPQEAVYWLQVQAPSGEWYTFDRMHLEFHNQAAAHTAKELLQSSWNIPVRVVRVSTVVDTE